MKRTNKIRLLNIPLGSPEGRKLVESFREKIENIDSDYSKLELRIFEFYNQGTTP